MEKLIETLELSDLQKQFLRSRWLEQISWMGGRARDARNWYYRLRLTAIIGGIIVPILVSLNISDKNVASSYVRWGTIGLGAVVAISSAVEEFFHYGDCPRGTALRAIAGGIIGTQLNLSKLRAGNSPN